MTGEQVQRPVAILPPACLLHSHPAIHQAGSGLSLEPSHTPATFPPIRPAPALENRASPDLYL